MRRSLILPFLLIVGCVSHFDKPKVDTRPLDLSIPPPATAAVISPSQSKITFIGTATATSREGAFGRFGGWIDCPDGQLEHAKVFVEIDMNSAQTGIDLLDRHLKDSNFFDTARYPRSSFVSIGATSDSVSGNLTIHGVTRAVTCPARWTIHRASIDLETKLTIKQSDFRMESVRETNDDVAITISLHAIQKTAHESAQISLQ